MKYCGYCNKMTPEFGGPINYRCPVCKHRMLKYTTASADGLLWDSTGWYRKIREEVEDGRMREIKIGSDTEFKDTPKYVKIL